MLKRRRGVSILIGVAFFLKIFMTGFAYYALMLQARAREDNEWLCIYDDA